MSRWFECKADSTQELSAKRLHAWLQTRTGPISGSPGPPPLLEPGTIYLALHSGKPQTPLDLHPVLRENWIVKNKRNTKRGRTEIDEAASEWLFASKKPNSRLGLRALVCKAGEVPNETKQVIHMASDESLYLFCAYSKQQSPNDLEQHATTERFDFGTPMPHTFTLPHMVTLVEELTTQDTQHLLRLLRQHADAMNAIAVVLTRRLDHQASIHMPQDIRQPPDDDLLLRLLDDL